MTFSEEHKIVQCFYPADNQSGAATVCDIVSLKGWDHATFICSFGAVTASMTGTLIAYKGENVTTCTVAFACRYRYEPTSDSMGAVTTLAVGGLNLATGEAGDVLADDTVIIVEIDAADLAPTIANPYDTVRVGWTNSAHATLLSIVCILSRGRYQDASPPTAIDN